MQSDFFGFLPPPFCTDSGISGIRRTGFAEAQCSTVEQYRPRTLGRNVNRNKRSSFVNFLLQCFHFTLGTVWDKFAELAFTFIMTANHSQLSPDQLLVSSFYSVADQTLDHRRKSTRLLFNINVVWDSISRRDRQVSFAKVFTAGRAVNVSS